MHIVSTMNTQVSALSPTDMPSRSPETLAFASPLLSRPPQLSPLTGLALQHAGTTQWRAIDDAGRVVGHIQPLPSPDGTRYRARRYKQALTRFVDLGDFWSPDEAAWCLRYSK